MSSAYLGPVEYFTYLLNASYSWIEVHENFHKQTYRNRCIILGANGPVSLVIPVTGGRNSRTLIKDIRISYDTDWQRIHWKTILSAYGSSPFFQFYDTEFQPFYMGKKWKFLIDLNSRLQEKIVELTGFDPKILLTSGFEMVNHPFENYRERINPFNKKSANHGSFVPEKYRQVFDNKFGFVPNLSIIDLLFNEGPDTLTILRKGTLKSA